MRLKKILLSHLMKKGLKYVQKNPQKNVEKIITWAERLATREEHKLMAKKIRKIWQSPGNNWNIYMNNLLTQLHPRILEKLVLNFFVNSSILGVPQAKKLGKRYKCNIPWAILLDPTAACNLNCTGCWAAEYDKTAAMDFMTLEKIITDGKELGVYMYIFSGGEPLVRKADLLKLAEKHQDCSFLSFTNATLVDEEFAQNLVKVGNLVLAISIEGFAAETDMRRGQGTYEKVLEAMDLLKKAGAGFGFSTCYHQKNTHVVGSEEYVDLMLAKGCQFGWYFTYIPLGKDARPELIANADQREFMYHQVREFRRTKPIYLMDFWNDGEFVEGCIAGGRSYIHINANGDVEPCAFIHYSNANIKETDLLTALKSPIMEQYRIHQPFNQNHLRPCPLLDNPEKLRMMIKNSSATSTQPVDQEAVEELTARCQEVSEKWAEKAEDLWNKQLKENNSSLTND